MRPRIGRASLQRREVLADLPASPPPHVLRDVARAAQRVDELQDLDRELHFEADPDHRVLVQIRDLSGRVLRAIPPSEALEVLSGVPLCTPAAHIPVPPNRKLP